MVRICVNMFIIRIRRVQVIGCDAQAFHYQSVFSNGKLQLDIVRELISRKQHVLELHL